MSILFLVLKWLSQLLIVTSGIYGMFSDLYKQDEHTKKRKLTRAGVVNLATLLVGLLLFGITDFQERQAQKEEAQAKLEAAKKETEFQTATNGQLRGQNEQLKEQTELQQGELRYLHHLILVQEVLEGWELSWKPSAAVIQVARSKAQSLHGSDQAYLQGCLRHSSIVARRSPNEHWLISCALLRPQGMLNLSFDLSPSQAGWQVFESTIDALLSPRFSISQKGGEDFVLLTTLSRPDELSYDETRIAAIVRPHVRLSRLEEPVQAVIRMDTETISSAPDAIRIRSLDPNLQQDQTFNLTWKKQQVGTRPVYSADPGDEPPGQAPVYAIFSGPHQLKGTFNRLLFAFEKGGSPVPKR